MAKDRRISSRTLFACWLLCVFSPSLLAMIEVAGVTLPGRLVYDALYLGIMGGCICVLLAEYEWPGRVVAMTSTIVIAAAQILVLGMIFFARDGAVGTQ